MGRGTTGSGERDPAELYDATAAYAWRLALCLHGEPAAAEHALVRAYRTLLAEPRSTALPAGLPACGHRDRTRLLALLTEQARPVAAAG